MIPLEDCCQICLGEGYVKKVVGGNFTGMKIDCPRCKGIRVNYKVIQMRHLEEFQEGMDVVRLLQGSGFDGWKGKITKVANKVWYVAFTGDATPYAWDQLEGWYGILK